MIFVSFMDHSMTPSSNNPATVVVPSRMKGLGCHPSDRPLRVALLLSCSSFEGFFKRVQGQTRASYLANYRNDWSWYYASGMLDNGVEPLIYVPSLQERGRYETDAGVPVRYLPLAAWYWPIENVWLKRLCRTNRFSLYADEWLNSVAFFAALETSLHEDRVDILYVQEYWSGRFDHLARRLQMPVVGADHGGLSTRVLKFLKRSAMQQAALCYCQTADECAIVGKFGGSATWAPNGCDTSQFTPGSPAQRGRSILTVARLTNKQKRTSDLVRALARLPEEWTLDIVGSGPDRPMLERLISRLRLKRRVTFHGFVERGAIAEFYRRCGVFAMPSSNEAVALSALEAMACGAAVVLSRIRAFSELVTDGVDGRLVDVGDVSGLAEAILDAWERRADFGPSAHKAVSTRYDSQRLYARLTSSLREVAGRTTSGAHVHQSA